LSLKKQIEIKLENIQFKMINFNSPLK